MAVTIHFQPEGSPDSTKLTVYVTAVNASVGPDTDVPVTPKLPLRVLGIHAGPADPTQLYVPFCWLNTNVVPVECTWVTTPLAFVALTHHDVPIGSPVSLKVTAYVYSVNVIVGTVTGEPATPKLPVPGLG
jgi:hypothetical protein